MAEILKQSLYLHEEILLLSLHDQKGTIDYRAGLYRHVLAGAIIAELLLADRVRMDDSRKKMVNVIDNSLIDEPVLDKALLQMAEAKRRKSIQGWVAKLATTPKLTEHIAQGLCKKGILREEEANILWIFKSKRYPEVNPGPERALLDRIQKAIFTDQENVDSRTSVLISLSHRSNLLSIAFSNKDLRKKKERIEKIINGELIGKTTGEVIKAVRAAATMAAIMPAIIASTTTVSSGR
jgi:Golgi phosphoprotein 3